MRRSEVSRFRWVVCIATLLLLCIVGPSSLEMGAEQPIAAHGVCVAGEGADATVISDPENDILTHLCTTNRLGLSSNTLHLHTSAGRTISFRNLSQRIARVAMSYLGGTVATENLDYAQCHSIASIRFHIGYFIYHRCQMRC